MKLIVAFCLVVAASAAPQFRQNISPITEGQPEVRILSRNFDNDDTGNYQFSYEQDNGQRVEEVGRFQPGPEPETGSLSQQGSYEFVSDDGNTYQVSYVADENGFQPQAAHLPQPPAQIPEYAQLRIDFPQLFWADDSEAAGGQQQIDDNQFVSVDSNRFDSRSDSFNQRGGQRAERFVF